MSFREHLAIYKKSFGLLKELAAEYIICMEVVEILNAILPYIPIFFSAKLIDALYEKESLETLIFYVVLTVGMVFLLNLLKGYIVSRRDGAYPAIFCRENWKYSKKAMTFAYESIEDRDTAILQSRTKMDSQTGYNFYHLQMILKGITKGMIQMILSLALTVSFFTTESIPAMMKILLLMGVVLTLLFGTYTTQKREKIWQEFSKQNTKLNMLSGKYSDFTERYASGMDIRLYDMSESLAASQAGFLKEYYENATKNNMKVTAIGACNTVMSQGLKFATYMILIYTALSGGLSVGSIAKYVSCLMLMLNAIWGIVEDVQLSFINNIYLKRFFSYFDIPNNMYQGTLTVEKRDDNEYFVEFRNVSFKYPNTETYALKNVNIKFRVGEKLAIVGMNGSGKTTFIKLMCRLYDPTEGQILLNGVDIRKYDYDEYMSIFSVVFQDFGLFSFSLGENVATAPQYDGERVKECLRRAGFGERLAQMPKGLDTILYKHYDKEGIEISGGEAQKIALARALYKDAPFIILDEPTAALDPVSEYEIYSKFNSIVGDKTAIYISHRLASCRFCDNILVFDNGTIIQHGNHAELLAQAEGKYSELWNAQAQYYVGET